MKKIRLIMLVLVLSLFMPVVSFAGTNTDKCAVYLHFNNVMTGEGFKDFDYIPQYLSPGVGWNFTKKKLDNFISCKSHFEYEGDEYTYNGNWKYADGSAVTFPVSVKPKNGETEINITVYPDYDIKVVKHLTVKRIDVIRDTSASSSNVNKAVSYTHTFENPEDLGNLPDYKFLGWSNGDEIVQPGESVSWVLDDFEQKDNEITYEALYQPGLTVNWYVEDELVHSDSDFNSVSSKFACNVKGFKSWVDTDGNEAEEVYYSNDINEEPKVVDLVADIEVVDDKDTDEETTPTATTPDDTKTKKSTDKTVYKPKQQSVVTASTPIIDVTDGYVTADDLIEVEDTKDDGIILDSSIPLSSPIKHDTWALVNLILMLMTVFALLKLSDRRYNIVSIILPALSILVFIFTENVHNEMILVDNFTVVMLIIYVIELVARLMGKTEEEEEYSE